MQSNSIVFNNLQEKFKALFPQFWEKIPALLQLIRFDKPIGVLLLLWPTLSALWIAAEGLPDLDLLFIFVVGTFLMRSAGCCVNDFADMKFDGEVNRTKSRPLAKGALERKDAIYLFLLLSGLGFILVLFTNMQTILLSLGAAVIVVIYPFMKRITSFPQVVLGVAFSWGILMAFTAQTGSIPEVGFLLFVANVLWTVAYDTEYAMVDRDDDIKIGIRSTAILFGTADRAMIALLATLFLVSVLMAALQLEMGAWFYAGFGCAVVLFLYQLYLIRERVPDQCFKAFLNNNWVGAALFSGIVLNYL